jgi:hypothetical protein
MAHVLPPTDDMLHLIAEMRAEGKGWEAIAARVNRCERTVRRWRTRYRDRWESIQVRAERHVATEAECESVLALRGLLRSKDEKTRWHAAKTLLSLRVELGKLEFRKPPGQDTAPPSAELQFLMHIQGRSNEELDALDASLRSLPDAEAPEHPADAGAGPA